jgi:hypothetical protein
VSKSDALTDGFCCICITINRGPLKEALEKKRPLTRSVLEARIDELQTLLDDAVARKAFQECAPLQDKLERLARKRNDLPTLDELKEAVHKAEQDVADAAARRDFAGAGKKLLSLLLTWSCIQFNLSPSPHYHVAASLQAALDNAIQRLKDAAQAENISVDIDSPQQIVPDSRFQSRAELEVAITETSRSVQDAIAKKQFNEATRYQTELDELEALRPTLPSLEELEAKITELKDEMEGAIKKKNFQNAESLQTEIDALEAKLEEEKSKMPSDSEPEPEESTAAEFINENGEKITFESRHKLEEEIKR